jgi:hypothetical protein
MKRSQSSIPVANMAVIHVKEANFRNNIMASRVQAKV